MTDKVQKIREEVERLKEETSIGLSEHENGVEQGRMEILNAISNLFDSMQEEPQVKKSAELQHINETCKDSDDSLRQEPVSDDLEKAAVEAFKQIVDSDKNNFLEIFKAGAAWKNEQMMAKAVDGVITFDYYEGDKAYGCVAHDSFCLEDLGLKDMDEVKILILKKSNEL